MIINSPTQWVGIGTEATATGHLVGDCKKP